MLSNFDSAVGASEVAMNSFGSASRENAAYLDSIEGKMAGLTAQFEAFFTKGISSGAVKTILSFATSILEVVNALGGLQTFIPVLVTFAGIFIGNQFPNAVNNLKNSFTSLIEPFKNIPVAIKAATSAFSSLRSVGEGTFSSLASGVGAFSRVMGVGGFLGILSAGISIFSALSAHASQVRAEQQQKAEELRQKESELTNTLGEQLAQYRELAAQKKNAESDEERVAINKQLSELQGKIVDSIGDEAAGIDLVNGKYEEQSQILGGIYSKRLANNSTYLQAQIVEAEKGLKEAQTASVEATGSALRQFRQVFGDEWGKMWDNNAPVEEQISKLSLMLNKLRQAEGAGMDVSDALGAVATKLSNLQEAQDKVNTAQDAYIEAIKKEGIEALTQMGAAEIKNAKDYDNLVKTINSSDFSIGNKSIEESRKILLNLAESEYAPKFKDSLAQMRNALNAEGDEIEAGAQGISDRVTAALKIEPETAHLANMSKGYEQLMKNLAEGNRGAQTQELMSIFFGDNWYADFNGDWELAEKTARERYESFYKFIKDGDYSKLGDLITKAGVSPDIASVDAAGNIMIKNAEKLAQAFGIPQEALSALLEAYKQTGGVIEYDFDSLMSKASELGLVVDDNGKKLLMLGADAQTAMNMTDVEFYNFIEQAKAAGVEILDLQSSTQAWTDLLTQQKIISVDATTGQATAKLSDLVAFLSKMGFTSSEISEIIKKVNIKTDVSDENGNTPLEKIDEEIAKAKEASDVELKALLHVDVDSEDAQKDLTTVEGQFNDVRKMPNIVKTVTIAIKVTGPGAGNPSYDDVVNNYLSKVKGSWTGTPPTGAPKNELSWLGEKGPELVTDKHGRNAYIAGEHGAELGYLHKGDVVYNAQDTRDIFSGDGTIDGVSPIDNNWSAPGVKKKGSGKKSSKKSRSKSKSKSKSSSASKQTSDAAKKALQRQKENYEDALDYINDLADKEIKALEKQKKKEQEYWDAKIKALQKQNEELDKQLELEEALESLAKAENTRVRIYREGKGFVYESDIGAVNEAQKNLDEVRRKQAYEKELEDLQNQKQASEDKYDEKIQYWEDYKDLWQEAADSYENNQKRLIAQQIFGVNEEQKNWEKRLGNLKSFISQYNSILQQLDDNYISPGKSSGGGSSSTKSSGTLKKGSKGDNVKALQNALNSLGYGNLAVDGVMGTQTINALKKFQKDSGLSADGVFGSKTQSALSAKGFASGSSCIPRNMIGRINESGSELYIPPQQNILAPLSRGSGIVPHTLAQNLMEIGQYHPSQWLSMMGANNNLGAAETNNCFNFEKLVLPNVKDASSFVNTLKNNFMSTAIQVGSLR